VPFAEVNDLTKLLPNVYKDESRARPSRSPSPRPWSWSRSSGSCRSRTRCTSEVIEIARKLEGLYRQAGMHAAGIVIADSTTCGTSCRSSGQRRRAGHPVLHERRGGQAGLVKFDFLGLKTLDVIYYAERHVNERLHRVSWPAKDVAKLWRPTRTSVRKLGNEGGQAGRGPLGGDLRHRLRGSGLQVLERAAGPHPPVSLLSLDDAKVYELISKGETLGVFQLESTGFQELLKRLKPDCFEDVVAAVALYRPGPLQTGMVDDFIDCKHGKKKVKYPHPCWSRCSSPPTAASSTRSR
jgi:DNA polymerase-3 subunit alpha